MQHDEPYRLSPGDHERRRWQPQPPPQEEHLENYLNRGSLDPEEKHALVDMIASVAQRISPSWRDYRIGPTSSQNSLNTLHTKLGRGRHPLGSWPSP